MMFFYVVIAFLEWLQVARGQCGRPSILTYQLSQFSYWRVQDGEDLLTIQVRDTTLCEFKITGVLPGGCGRWEDVPGGVKPKASALTEVPAPLTPSPPL